MRNVWKGLVVGGLTGVATGVALDAAARASHKAAAIGEQMRDHAPEAGRWLQTMTGQAGERIRHAEVPEHVRDAALRVKESEAAHRAAQVSHDVASAAKEAAPARTG